MTEIGIVDIREIFRVIKSKYGYDFSQYALTSFKHRLELIMIRHNLGQPENLINKFKNNRDFFELFLYEISIPSTEMFRDPSLWRWLKEEHFPRVIEKNIGKYKIWLPNCVSGGELYSLAILLKELDMLDKVNIIATSFSTKSIEFIKNGQYELKKIEVSKENYRRFKGTSSFSEYYDLDRYYANRDVNLIKDVEFNRINIDFSESPQNVKLIFFRNSLIYYNPALQDKILELMHKCLSASGNLVLGIQERIKNISTRKDFEIVNEAESVYKKRISVKNEI